MARYLPAKPNTFDPDQVSKIHEALIYIGIDFDTRSEDYIERVYGEYTQSVVASFQQENKIDISSARPGTLTETTANLINGKIYNRDNPSPEQTIELFRILKRIGYNVSQTALSKGMIDLQMTQSIRAFQKRMLIDTVGYFDTHTTNRLNYFKDKEFPEYFSFTPKNKIARLQCSLDYSSEGNKVRNLHESLSALGYLVEIPEYNHRFYGRSTVEAVKKVQRNVGIGINGRLNTKTAQELNKLIDEKNPGLVDKKTKYRVRGSILNDKFAPIKNCEVEIFHYNILEAPVPIKKRKTYKTGFYDIVYTPKIGDNGKVDPKNNSLLIKVTVDSTVIKEEIINNVAPVHWFSFNIGEEAKVYLGKNLFGILNGKLKNISGYEDESSLNWFLELREDDSEGLTNLSKKIGVEINTLMKLFLAYRVSRRINNEYNSFIPQNIITPEIIFALIYAGNTILPDNILPDSDDVWNHWIEEIEVTIMRGFSLMNTETLKTIFEGAIRGNVISTVENRTKIPELCGEIIPRLGDQVILDVPMTANTSEKFNASFRTLFNMSGVKSQDMGILSHSFIQNKDFNDDFWTEIKPRVSQETFNKLQLNVEYGYIVDFNEHNTNIVTTRLVDSKLDNAYRIAEFSKEDWERAITEYDFEVPDYPEEKDKRPVELYANELYLKTIQRYPSLSFVSHITPSPGLPDIGRIKEVLVQNPHFNLLAQELDPFLKEIGAGEELKEQYLLVQRLQSYTPEGTTGNALLRNKFHSASQIVNYTYDTFVATMTTEQVSESDAQEIFRKAESNYATLLSFFSEFSPQTNQTPLYVLNNNSEARNMHSLRLDSTIPDLESLFGSLDSCACSECQSVVGASAYLVDIIRFLKSRIAKPSIPGYTTTVKDVLLERRPDIDYIKLNCTNTNTALPYIDIVCEVLENQVSKTAGQPDPDYNEYQTELTAEELRAFPEYINKYSYNYLSQQIYPLHSPVFNLWQENTRLFLSHLGSSWWKFMEIWQRQSSQSYPSNYLIASEYFGFSSVEASIIDNSYLSANGISLPQMLKIMWNIDFESLSPVSYASVEVDWFLKSTKLSYDELLILLSCEYINVAPPANHIKIEIPLNGDPCSTSTQRITNLTIDRYNRIQRFLRLWRHSTWTIWELDILLQNGVISVTETTSDPINENTIINLMLFAELQKKFKLSVEELLTFWGNINTENFRTAEKEISSLYKRLFLNMSFVNPVADDFYKLAYDPSELPSSNFNKERITFLSASLSYSEVNVRKILDYYDNPQNGSAENVTFSLEAIAYVYRHILLIDKLKISFEDLLTFKKISNINNLFDSVESVKNVVDTIEFMKSVSKNFNTWDYVLERDNEDDKLSLNATQLSSFLKELRIGISNSNSEITDIVNPSRSNREQAELLFQRLPQFENTGQIDMAIKFVEGKSISDPPQYPDPTTPENIRKEFFNQFFSLFIPKSEWENALNVEFAQAPNSSGLPEELINERYEYLFGHLHSFALQLSYNQIISQQLNINQDILSVLFQNVDIELPSSVNNNIIAQLFGLTDDLTAKESDGSYTFPLEDSRFDILRKIYLLLHKISVTLNFFPDMTSDELERYMDYQTQLITNYPSGAPMLLGITNLSKLPVDSSSPSSNLFELLNWIKLEKIRVKFEDETNSFFELLNNSISLEAISDSEMAQLFATLSGESFDVVNYIITHLDIEQLQFTDASIWNRILDCLKNYHTIGSDPEVLVSWLNKNNDPVVEETISNDVTKASKAKYSLESWLKVVQPFQDILREKKRDALVAFLIEHSMRNENPTVPYPAPAPPEPVYVNTKYWSNHNDLYAYFLLDVDMSSCQLTSRIRQASLSVQVFVQRCFLGLEKLHIEIPNINAQPNGANNWAQWQWMKYYRLWDANRQIFLYPENWIEPELRMDMSPFFKELTEELSQADVTDDYAETVLNNYLNKLQEVAQLDIVSVYHEVEPGINVFHVIGKTKANPSNFYYRSFNQITKKWTAWEKISADITGMHPLLTKYNGKIYLFWLLFEEKADKVKKVPASQLSNTPKDAPESPKLYEIRLSWIRRNRDGWTEKKVSNERMIHPWGRPKYSYNLRPRLKTLDNTLWIDLYITTSREFNRPARFYNQNTGTFNHIAKAQFDERFRPWHSSSFVFNGEVKELRLRKMYGNFSVFAGTNSYEYVNKNFEDAGRAIKHLSSDIQPKINLPWGMHFEYTYLRNNISQNINTYQFNTLESGNTKRLLKKARPTFKLPVSLQDQQINFNTVRPFFYQDSMRSFFIRPHYSFLTSIDVISRSSSWSSVIDRYIYEFSNFYHPYAQVFIQELNKSGLKGLYNRRLQTEPESTDFYPGNTFSFQTTYLPENGVVSIKENARKDITDFSSDGAYSLYNWELFFHIPFYIANKLSQNQRFEEAMKWYQYIFDPNSSDNYSEPKRFWITKPFFQMSENDYNRSRINYILSNISSYSGQVAAWKNDPFNPHIVASGRPVAYQKAVVMKFIDNLIAWGDNLFRMDTLETIHEAITLYLLAYQILGKKPEKVPGIQGQSLNLSEIFSPSAGNFVDIFGGASVDLENYLINYTGSSEYEVTDLPIAYTNIIPNLRLKYFCIPDNPKLLSYWALVEDRLFKIRHCMNIEGVVRQLPLFEPPIDPALLVRARAQGVSISSLFFNLNTPAPNYRFRTLIQKTIEYCSEVRNLGERLLSIIERLDAENLSVLRSTNELNLLDLITETKELQIREADENIAGLQVALEMTEAKLEYFQSIPRMNDQEKIGEALLYASTAMDVASGVISSISGTMTLIPSVTVGGAGAMGSPVAITEVVSGPRIGSSMNTFASVLQIASGVARSQGSMLQTQGGYTRRNDDNKFQAEQALREIEQINIQITSAEIRKQIAEKDLRDHNKRIEQSKTELEFMNNKFSNAALYNWMLTQVTNTYFQAYQLAYDMAHKAEDCYKYELGNHNVSFIEYGYWDNLRKGLLAGEKLSQSLRRMEVSYLEQNKRELEITRHISLAQYFPVEFMKLKTTGKCEINLEEWFFDLDYPGQYKRRIKSVSVTAPCVAGPYTPVNCKLSMSSSSIRRSKERDDETNIYREYASQQHIVTSNAQGDSGMFQVNFNDERFLPFEGAGAISTWEISLPLETNQFDFTTLNDFILHLSYTSLEGDQNSINAAWDNINTNVLPNYAALCLNLKQIFPAEWYKNLAPENLGTNEMILNISNELFPFFFRNKNLKFKQLDLFIEGNTTTPDFDILMESPVGQLPNVWAKMPNDYGELSYYNTDLGGLSGTDHKGVWRLKILSSEGVPLDSNHLKNAYLIIHFEKA